MCTMLQESYSGNLQKHAADSEVQRIGACRYVSNARYGVHRQSARKTTGNQFSWESNLQSAVESLRQ